MKVIIIVLAFFFIAFLPGYSQSRKSDLQLLENIGSSTVSKSRHSVLYYNPISLSHRGIKKQIHLPDKYSNSFKDFTYESFRELGVIKGFFLSVDRISRSGKLSYMSIPMIRFNAKGEIIDLPGFYSGSDDK